MLLLSQPGHRCCTRVRSVELDSIPLPFRSSDTPAIFSLRLLWPADCRRLHRCPGGWMESHLRLFVCKDLELFLNVRSNANRRIKEAGHTCICLHFLIFPIVKGSRDVVGATHVWYLLVLLPIADDAIRIKLNLEDVVKPCVLVRTPHLPVLPVVSHDRHFLGRCLLHLSDEQAVEILAGTHTSGGHLIHAPDSCTSVGSAESEGEHAVEAGLRSECEVLCGHDPRKARHVQVRVQAIEVTIGSSFSIQAQQDALEEARHASASFAVADVGLRGSDDHRLMPRHHGHHLLVGSYLNGISQGCPSAVTLGGVHLSRFHVHLFDHCL
mmetsp:Transcript_30940/g.73767  ORF Transcript_30940/g.73767 Transcript_30940/m.73767 type:complete len:325 (+) Transcript_30940:20-994(+)